MPNGEAMTTNGYETITYAMPTKHRRKVNRISKFEGMEIDVLHARVFRPLIDDMVGIKRAKQNIGQSARLYGKRLGQKFKVEAIKLNGDDVIAVWRIA